MKNLNILNASTDEISEVAENEEVTENEEIAANSNEEVAKATEETDSKSLEFEQDLERAEDATISMDVVEIDEEDLSPAEAKKIKSVNASLKEKIDAMEKEVDSGKKEFKRAGKDVKKELYGNEHIFPIGERPAFKTEGEKRKEEHQELYDACRSERILTGIIEFQSEEFLGKDIGTMICANIMYGGYKIIIPLPFLSELNVNRNKNATKTETEKNAKVFVNARLGSEVEFCVTAVNEESQIAIGNRVMAMKRKKYASFLHKRRGKFLVEEGDIIEGRICYATKATLCVEVYGCEIILRENQVTNRRLLDMRELYHPGDYAPVKITKILRTQVDMGEGKRGYKLEVEGSIKDATPNVQKIAFDKIKENGTHRGVITQIDEHGVFVKLNGFEFTILCSPPREFKTPGIGSNILVGIHKKNEEKLTITGYIIHQII